MVQKVENPGDEYSREREFKVLVESLQSQFKVFGEGMNDLRNKFGNFENKFEDLKTEVGYLKLETLGLKHKIEGIENKVGGLENKVDRLDRFVRMIIPTIATKDDFKTLDRRVDDHETRLKILEKSR